MFKSNLLIKIIIKPYIKNIYKMYVKINWAASPNKKNE